MKVLVVCSKYYPEYSGPGLRAQNTYKRLRAKYGIGYEILTNSVEFNNNVKYKVDEIDVARIAKRLPTISRNGYFARLVNHIVFLLNFLYQGFLTLRILSAGDYDVIHTFGSSISIDIVILYAKYKNKVLLREICNNGTQPQPNLPLKLNKIFKYKFNRKSKVIAISKRIGDSCRREGIDEDHLWQRPNPVDQVRFAPERKDKYHLREELSEFDHDDIVLLNISKYGPGKNQIFLIDVIKLLEDKYKLLIFGPLVSQGPFRARDKSCYDNIVKAVEDERLSERVQVVADFTGSIEKYYKLADVFVFPTLFEALGTPMLESIACGVPVVANKIEGVTDCWIENEKTGFICELNPQKFADCIVKASKIDRDTLKQGSASILAKASAEVIDKCYFDLIMSLAATDS